MAANRVVGRAYPQKVLESIIICHLAEERELTFAVAWPGRTVHYLPSARIVSSVPIPVPTSSRCRGESGPNLLARNRNCITGRRSPTSRPAFAHRGCSRCAVHHRQRRSRSLGSGCTSREGQGAVSATTIDRSVSRAKGVIAVLVGILDRCDVLDGSARRISHGDVRDTSFTPRTSRRARRSSVHMRLHQEPTAVRQCSWCYRYQSAECVG
jgi:hypothetical protein